MARVYFNFLSKMNQLVPVVFIYLINKWDESIKFNYNSTNVCCRRGTSRNNVLNIL